jgi:hypothetical protein
MSKNPAPASSIKKSLLACLGTRVLSHQRKIISKKLSSEHTSSQKLDEFIAKKLKFFKFLHLFRSFIFF